MFNNDLTQDLLSQVNHARKESSSIRIVGGGSKYYLSDAIASDSLKSLSVCEHSGIIDYQPSELTITVRAGTPITKLRKFLAQNNQILPFDPPDYNGCATVGGVVSAGLSGSSRPYRGATRDYVLGITMINGLGQLLNFGGKVIKNVAGYDISRLVTGAYGTLGLISNITLRLHPRPHNTITLVYETDEAAALNKMRSLARTAFPIIGLAYHRNKLYLRLGNNASANDSMQQKLGGELMRDEEYFWDSVRDHQHDFFRQKTDRQLWRISMPSTTNRLVDIIDQSKQEDILEQFIDWGGALRWVSLIQPSDKLMGQFMGQFEGTQSRTLQSWNCMPYTRQGINHPLEDNRQSGIFDTLDNTTRNIHQRIKAAFDPDNIFNPEILQPSIQSAHRN